MDATILMHNRGHYDSMPPCSIFTRSAAQMPPTWVQKVHVM